jgi:hypothetical protein
LLRLRQKLKQKCLSHCFVAPVLTSEILFQGQHLFHILTTTIAPPAQDSAMAAALIVEVQGWLVSEDGWHCATNCAAPVGVQAAECNSIENE